VPDTATKVPGVFGNVASNTAVLNADVSDVILSESSGLTSSSFDHNGLVVQFTFELSAAGLNVSDTLPPGGSGVKLAASRNRTSYSSNTPDEKAAPVLVSPPRFRREFRPPSALSNTISAFCADKTVPSSGLYFIRTRSTPAVPNLLYPSAMTKSG
jgi:hypothetical protein